MTLLLNRLLERLLRAGDPWIARKVRAWLGEQADHGRLALDGSTLRVSGARIPLGARFALGSVRMSFADVLGLVTRGETRVHIEHAEMLGIAGLPPIEANATLSASTSSWRVDAGDVTCGDARVTVEASGSFGDAPTACVRAKIARLGATRLRSLLAELATTEPLRSLRVPDDVVVRGDVTWNLGAGTTLTLVIETAKSRVTVGVVIDEHGKLGDTNVSGAIALDDVVASGVLPTAIAARVEPLQDARASGEIVVGASGAIKGAAEIATATSKVDVSIALAHDGALDGTTLGGTLSFVDAVACGVFPGPVRPRRIGAMQVDARVAGTLAEATLSAHVTAHELRLRLGDDATLPTLFFHDVTTDLRVDARSLVWRELSARSLGGSLASSGTVTFGAASAVEATISCAALRLEAIPSNAEGATPLAEQMRGALHADLRVTYAAGALPPFLVRGPLRVVDPHFLFLGSAGDKLARYGLPAPEMRGAGPIEAEVDVRERVVRVAPIATRLDGIDVDGDVAIGFDGALQGELRAHLLQGYLRRSLLLAVPAAFAERVTVPITIGGSVREPDVSADLVQTLDNLLQKNAIGSAVTGVMDEVWSALGGPRASRSSRPPPPRKEQVDPLDALFDRILAGDADSDDLIDELVDAGLDAEEIERRLAQRRRA